MGDVVNLRRVRKSRVRDEKAKTAEINRAKFGQSKTLRSLTKAEEKLAGRILDAHQRDR